MKSSLRFFKKYFAIVLLSFLFTPSMAMATEIVANKEEGASAYSKIVGTWLIDTPVFDFMIETGALIADYPLLFLTETGQYRIYLLGSDCHLRNSYFPNYPHPLDIRESMRCFSHVSTRQNDLSNAFALLVSQGEVHDAGDGKWRLVPEDRGESMLQRIEAFKDYQLVNDGRIFREKLFLWMSSQPFSVSGEMMEFDPGHLVFSKHSKEALIDIGHLPALPANLSRLRYWRCMLGAYEEGGEKNPPLKKELALFRSLLRNASLNHDAQIAQYKAETAYVLAREKDNDASGEGYSNWREAFQEAEKQHLETLKYYEEIQALPIYQAIKEERLGAYLGCPERDAPRLKSVEEMTKKIEQSLIFNALGQNRLGELFGCTECDKK